MLRFFIYIQYKLKTRNKVPYFKLLFKQIPFVVSTTNAVIGTILLAFYGKKETFQEMNSTMSDSGSSGGLSKFAHDLKVSG